MSFSCSFEVPEDLPCFSGHFPDNPLVPGALLLAWVAREYRRVDSEYSIVGIKSAKFVQPVRPGAQIEFEFVPNREAASVRFSICICTEETRILAVSGSALSSRAA